MVDAMRAHLVWSVVVVSLLWCAGWVERAGARCAMVGLAPRVLTPVTANLPRDGGGVVVGMVSSATEIAMPAGVQLTRGRRSQELVARELAPGLVRFAAASRLQPGTWSASALGSTAVGAPASITVGREPTPAVPTRPAVSELRRVAATGLSARRQPRAEVRATLDFPVPPGIVAIITAWGDDGATAAWQPAIEGQREAVVWREPGRCERAIDGTIAPPDEAAAGRIAFVDAFGQVSPFSAAAPVR